MKLLNTRNDESWINVTGFTYDVALQLSRHLTVAVQCSLDVLGVTGLCLQYLNSTLPHKSLCQIYGITPAVCSRLINRGLDALHIAGQSIDECLIYWPTHQQQQYYSQFISNMYLLMVTMVLFHYHS